MKKNVLITIIGLALIAGGVYLNSNNDKNETLGNNKSSSSQPPLEEEKEETPVQVPENNNEETTEEVAEAYDYKNDIVCNSTANKSIYDIYHFDAEYYEEGVLSWTEQIAEVGTYTPKDLESDITSYFLINSGYIDCSVVEHSNDTNKKYKEDELVASIKKEDINKMIDKLYGTGNYKEYSFISLNKDSCKSWNLNNSKYELRYSSGCGFSLSPGGYKLTKKDIKTSGDNTIITEFIDRIDGNKKTTKLKIEYTVRTSDKVLIKIVTFKA